MKSLNISKILFVMAIGIFSSMTLASEREIEIRDKFATIFNELIHGNHLSKTQLAEMSKGSTKVEVLIDGVSESFRVVPVRESGLHVTSFKPAFYSHHTPDPLLNCVTGEFKSRYNYKNLANETMLERLVGGTVVYQLIFSGDSIKRLCEAAKQVATAEQTLVPVISEEKTGPVVLQTIRDAANDSSAEDDDVVLEFHDCQSTPSPEVDREDSSECDSFACGLGSPKGLKGTSVRLQLLKCALGDMGNIMQRAIEVAKHGDQIWCASANGLRGAMGLYEAASTFNVLSAFVGVADLASAVVSGVRVHKALSGVSNTTQKMFGELDAKLGALSGISDEMKGLLDQVKTSLGQVTESLEQYEIQKNTLMKRAQAAIGEEAAQIGKALEILIAAQADHQHTIYRLENISKAVSQIDGTWKAVTLSLTLLAETASAEIKDNENAKDELILRIKSIKKQTKRIEQAVESLDEPMSLVNGFIAEMGRLNVQIGARFSDAITHLVKVCADKSQLEKDFVLLCAENEHLKAARSQLVSIDGDATSLQCLNSQVKLLAKGAEGDVQELKVLVDAKYDLAHILVGAGVAVAAATLLAPGIVPTAGLGLLAVHGAKIVEWCSLGRNAGDNPLFQTRLGRWAYWIGVSEATIKAVGQSVLRIDYQALEKAQLEMESAKAQQNSNNEKK